MLRTQFLSIWVLALLYFFGLSRATVSPGDRECVSDSLGCGCTSLWDSDCSCVNADEDTMCGPHCPLLCKELWSPKQFKDYMTDCRLPKHKKYSITVFTYSRYKDAQELIAPLKTLMEIVHSYVNLEIIYIMHQNITNGTIHYESDFGEMDILEDAFQLCTFYHYGEPKVYLPFLYCLNTEGYIIDRFRNCSKQHTIDYDTILSCSENEGKRLLAYSSREVVRSRIIDGPIVFIDGRLIIPQRLTDISYVLSTMCHIPHLPLGKFPWWVFGFLGSTMVSLALVSFIFRSWSLTYFIERMMPN